jgi:hypothetical protein
MTSLILEEDPTEVPPNFNTFMDIIWFWSPAYNCRIPEFLRLTKIASELKNNGEIRDYFSFLASSQYLSISAKFISEIFLPSFFDSVSK